MKWIIRTIAALFVLALGVLELVLRHKINGFHTQRMPQQMIDQHTRLICLRPDLMWYWANKE